MGVAVGMCAAQAHQLQHLLDSLLTLVTITHPVQLQTFCNRRAHLGTGIEGSVGILEDDLDPTTERLQVLAREVSDVFAVEADGAAGRLQETGEHSTQCRLATARLSDEAEGLPLHDVEIDTRHRSDRGHGPLEDSATDRELLHQVPYLHQMLSHRGPRPSPARSRASIGPCALPPPRAGRA